MVNCKNKLPRKKGRDGDLASIPNEATAEFIKENFKFSTARVWLGGHRTASGPWTWSDGSKWLYENWYPGQPNEVESGGASIYLSPDNQENQRWLMLLRMQTIIFQFVSTLFSKIEG